MVSGVLVGELIHLWLLYISFMLHILFHLFVFFYDFIIFLYHHLYKGYRSLTTPSTPSRIKIIPSISCSMIVVIVAGHDHKWSHKKKNSIRTDKKKKEVY